MTDDRSRPDRSRPDLDDTTVEGLGKLSEALETIEQARGQLYGFHQHSGKADLLLQDAVDLFRKAGHAQLAERLIDAAQAPAAV